MANNEKRVYTKPKITRYGDLVALTKSTREPGTGDLIYDLVTSPGQSLGS